VDVIIGERSEVTLLEIDEFDHSKSPWIGMMFIKDSQGRQYWGFGGLETSAVNAASIDEVRLTYLPRTRFILKIEKPFDNTLPPFYPTSILGEPKDRVLYTDDPYWIIACVLVMMFIIGEKSKKR
ncbi:MAG: hypothetical protein IJ299_00535, partial [Oscillospiraceae bacterium]|nr:hypothetical protein [Oscillospiraceae bacterium]